MSLLQTIVHKITAELSWLEIAAALTSLIGVVLTVRNNIWLWFWGVISVTLYGWFFWRLALHANAWLQILYYLPMQFYGWYVWLRWGPAHNNDLPVTTLSNRARIFWLIATTLLSALIYAYLVGKKDDPQPLADGVTTAMSIVAQYLQTFKRLENWLLWLVADIIYVFYVVPITQHPVSCGLYILFTVLAALGAVEWIKIMRRQGERLPSP